MLDSGQSKNTNSIKSLTITSLCLLIISILFLLGVAYAYKNMRNTAREKAEALINKIDLPSENSTFRLSLGIVLILLIVFEIILLIKSHYWLKINKISSESLEINSIVFIISFMLFSFGIMLLLLM